MMICEKSDITIFGSENTIKLAPELAKYISESKLQQNALQYSELQKQLSEKEIKQIEVIKNELLQIPLIHATQEPFPIGRSILPISGLSKDHRGNTYELDRSLGLDQYVFFHWGLPEKSGYGRNFLITSASLLTNPNTIVTPTDIGAIIPVDQIPFDQLSSEEKEKYQIHYLDKMVTGNQWLEIIARRVLISYETKHSFFNLYSSSSFGEIKHLGQVNTNLIINQITDKQFKEYYKFLYEHGFSFDNMEGIRNLFQKTGKKYGVDPLPEECGIDYQTASNHWKNLLD